MHATLIVWFEALITASDLITTPPRVIRDSRGSKLKARQLVACILLHCCFHARASRYFFFQHKNTCRDTWSEGKRDLRAAWITLRYILVTRLGIFMHLGEIQHQNRQIFYSSITCLYLFIFAPFRAINIYGIINFKFTDVLLSIEEITQNW